MNESWTLKIYNIVPRRHSQMLKYLFAGGIVVAVNMSVLYTLTEFFGVYYLVSAILAFCIAFVCSFVLQKYWTFSDTSTHQVRDQAVKYLLLQIGNVACNTALLYLLVEYAHLWYVLAQLVVSFFLAAVTFVIVRRYIFVTPNPTLCAG